jgi:radical SAM superfamily enzyme YgiQ (UPF0313 family)
MKPHIILLSDFTDSAFLTKSIGAHKVAYELRQAGYDVAVINHLHMFSYEELLHILSNLISEKTLFIGVSNRFYKDISFLKNVEMLEFYKTATANVNGYIVPHGKEKNVDIKQVIKSINDNVKFVIGGALAYDLDFNKDFDYVVSGYADLSVVNLANHLSTGEKLLNSYKSIYGPTIINDSVAKGFDFVNSTMEYAPEDCVLDGETLQIEISRGCIFKCSFCAYPLNGKKKFDYIKKEEILYNEFVNNYEKYKITRYLFSDDTFNDSVEKCEMIHRISKRLPFKLEYWAFARLDLMCAHPTMIDLMCESGCRAFFFGIETFNQPSGAIIGKGMKKEKLIATLEKIKLKYGNQVSLHGSFILGLPKEDMASMKQTINYLTGNQCALDSWSMSFVTINNTSGKVSEFVSEFERNWKDYGYKVIKTDNGREWANEFITQSEGQQMIIDAAEKSKYSQGRAMGGGLAMQLSGLGIDLDSVINKTREEVDWGEILDKKNKRFNKYKEIFYSKFNIPAFITNK